MNQPYRHILAAVDLDEGGAQVLQRAQQLAHGFAARLSVVHVVEYVSLDTGEALIATPVDLSQQMVHQATQQLQTLCAQHDIHAAAARVLSGPIASEILHAAREGAVDLIVIGHQPRRGFFDALLSHTEESVVSRAPCDVLALALPASSVG